MYLQTVPMKLGMTEFPFDTYLLYQTNIIMILYIDDVCIVTPNQLIINKFFSELKDLGFNLKIKRSFNPYLNIGIEALAERTYQMNQKQFTLPEWKTAVHTGKTIKLLIYLSQSETLCWIEPRFSCSIIICFGTTSITKSIIQMTSWLSPNVLPNGWTPAISPKVLFESSLMGIGRIYKVGGTQPSC